MDVYKMFYNIAYGGVFLLTLIKTGYYDHISACVLACGRMYLCVCLFVCVCVCCVCVCVCVCVYKALQDGSSGENGEPEYKGINVAERLMEEMEANILKQFRHREYRTNLKEQK